MDSVHTTLAGHLLALCAVCLLQLCDAQMLFQTNVPVPVGNGIRLQEFVISADDEPIDAIERFRRRNNMDATFRTRMLRRVCQQQHIRCQRSEPIVFATQVSDEQGRKVGQIQLLESEEAADAVYAFGLSHGLSRHARTQLTEYLCLQPQVRCTRKRAIAYWHSISDEQGASMGDLVVYDDEEPVDQIYRFVVDHDLPRKRVLNQLVDLVCAQVECTRRIPWVYAQEIRGRDGNSLGWLIIPEGKEPADAVYEFALARGGLDRDTRRFLVRAVCESKYTECQRDRPYVFSAPIVTEEGAEPTGVLNVMEDQELADAIYAFAQDKNMTSEVKHMLLQTLCGREGLVCTRARALLSSVPVADPEGGTLGVIEVYDGQEPVDVIYDFAVRHGISDFDRGNLYHQLCESEKATLNCTRWAPVVFAIPIAASNGSTLGTLEVLDGEEPADAIARFGNKHGLSDEEKHSILQGVCDASGLPCSRKRGLMYRAPYTLRDGTVERLEFYDGQEPADVIYDYGQMRNLTFRERKDFLVDACTKSRGRLNCTRAEAMLVKIPVYESADKKLADLEVLEGQEPIDMVHAFLEKHDLFQTAPLNTSLLEIVCNSTKVECKRTRPRRILFTMQATYAGLLHTLQYVRPENDWICGPNESGTGQKCVHYVEVLSREFCATHMYDWAGCEQRMLEALRHQLEVYEERMWRGKDMYAKLGLVRTATTEEIVSAYNTLVKRFNNETEPQKYEKLREAYGVLSDPEEKYFYDLPCLKFFGLCGKKKKDGSISITPPD